MMVETVLESNGETVTNSSVSSRETKNQQNGNSDHYNPSVRELNIPKLPSGSCGFHLSRSKWDPYPWVSEHGELIKQIKRTVGKYRKE